MSSHIPTHVIDSTLGRLDDLRMSQALPQLFAGLAPEQKVLDDYVQLTNNTVETMLRSFLEDGVELRRPKFLGPALGDDKAVLDRDDLACRTCTLAILESALEVEWPKMMREQGVRDLLPGALSVTCLPSRYGAHDGTSETRSASPRPPRLLVRP